MKRIKDLTALFRAIGVAVGVYLSKLLISLPSAATMNQTFLLLIVVSLILLTAKAAEGLVSVLFDKFHHLRMLVEWSDFIEGFWFDHCNQGLGEYALLSITHKDGEYLISGQSFSKGGELLFSWTSILSHYKDDSLEYLYQSTDLRSPTAFSPISGYLKVDFRRNSPRGIPRKYTGTLLDFSITPLKPSIRGMRISSKEYTAAQSDLGMLEALYQRL